MQKWLQRNRILVWWVVMCAFGYLIYGEQQQTLLLQLLAIGVLINLASNWMRPLYLRTEHKYLRLTERRQRRLRLLLRGFSIGVSCFVIICIFIGVKSTGGAIALCGIYAVTVVGGSHAFRVLRMGKNFAADLSEEMQSHNEENVMFITSVNDKRDDLIESMNQERLINERHKKFKNF